MIVCELIHSVGAPGIFIAGAITNGSRGEVSQNLKQFADIVYRF